MYRNNNIISGHPAGRPAAQDHIRRGVGTNANRGQWTPKQEARARGEAVQIIASKGSCLYTENFPVEKFGVKASGLSKALLSRTLKRDDSSSLTLYRDALTLLAQAVAKNRQFDAYLQKTSCVRDPGFSKNCALLANAFSKLLNSSYCKKAIIKIAGRIATEPNLDKFNEHNLANLANAFSKLVKDSNSKCAAAMVKIAGRIATEPNLEDFGAQALANLANAFSKLANDANCTAAIIKIAGRIATEPNLEKFNEQHLANLANAFSKLVKDSKCAASIIKIAERIATEPNLKKFNEQEIVNDHVVCPDLDHSECPVFDRHFN